jgi:transcriptional regulator with GAF, ATPase, and Fis domain
MEIKMTLPLEGLCIALAVENLERELIAQAMERANNHITSAAKLLGMNRSTLHYRLGKLGYFKRPVSEAH